MRIWPPDCFSLQESQVWARDVIHCLYVTTTCDWTVSCVVLNPGVQPRAGNMEVTGIPQVDYSTSQRQLASTQAEVAYHIKTPITTKPVARTN